MNIKKDFVEDTQFPFVPDEKLKLTIDPKGKRVIIEKIKSDGGVEK